MDVITLRVANQNSLMLEEPGEVTFDDAAVLSQSASVRCIFLRSLELFPWLGGVIEFSCQHRNPDPHITRLAFCGVLCPGA